MGPGSARRDQLVAHAAEKRKVGDPVAVQMPELAPTETKLDPPETVRPDLDLRPRSNRRGDPLTRAGLLVSVRHHLAPSSTSPTG